MIISALRNLGKDFISEGWSIPSLSLEIPSFSLDRFLPGLPKTFFSDFSAKDYQGLPLFDPGILRQKRSEFQAGVPIIWIAVGISALAHGAALFAMKPKIETKATTENKGLDSEVEDRLIKEAEQRLKELTKNPQEALPSDTFLLDVDTRLSGEDLPDREGEKARLFWESRIPSYQKIVQEAGPDPMNQVKALRDQLYIDFYWHYGEEYGNLGKALLKPQFQCFSIEKLLLAAISKTGIHFPDHIKLGVQEYYTHTQAVLYNEKTGTVYDIAFGEESDTNHITGDIYHASIYYHAFLKARTGVWNWAFHDSPWKDEDFLIRRANFVEDRAFKKERPRDKNYSFPETDVMYPGLAPKDGIQPFPHDRSFDPEDFKNTFKQKLDSEKNEARLSLGSKSVQTLSQRISAPKSTETSDPVEPPFEVRVDALGRENRKENLSSQMKRFGYEAFSEDAIINMAFLRFHAKERPLPYNIPSLIEAHLNIFGFAITRPMNGKKTLLLQTDGEGEVFGRLSGNEMKQAFLVDRIRKEEEKQIFQKSAALLSSPQVKAKEMSPQDLNEALFFIQTAHRTAKSLEEYSPDHKYQNEESVFWSGIISRSQLWNKIETPLKNWNDWVKSHPEDFLEFLNDLPTQKKRIFLELTSLDSLQPVFGLIQAKVKVTNKKEEETPYVPPQEEILIDVDLEALDPAQPSPPPPSPPQVKAAQEDVLGGSSGEIRISPETSIAVELFASHRGPITPFTPFISRLAQLKISQLKKDSAIPRSEKVLKEVKELWTPELIERFKRMNSEGDWDTLFLNYVDRNFPQDRKLSPQENKTGALLYPLKRGIEQKPFH